MKFFLDHDIHRAIREALERHGFEVEQVTDVLPREALDEAVFSHAICRGCIMITCNRDDFLTLAKRRAHAGLIILIRRRGESSESAKLLELIRRAGEAGQSGNINFA